MTVVPETRRTH